MQRMPDLRRRSHRRRPRQRFPLHAAKTNHGRATHGNDAGGRANIAAACLHGNGQAVWDNIYNQTLDRMKRTCSN